MKNGRRDERQVTAEQAKEYKEKYDSKAVQNAMKFLTYFESTFTCSGICESSMFYFTLPMADGPPSSTCLLHMKEVIANNLTYMGMTSTVCGFIMFFIWICQYCLWRKYEEEK